MRNILDEPFYEMVLRHNLTHPVIIKYLKQQGYGSSSKDINVQVALLRANPWDKRATNNVIRIFERDQKLSGSLETDHEFTTRIKKTLNLLMRYGLFNDRIRSAIDKIDHPALETFAKSILKRDKAKKRPSVDAHTQKARIGKREFQVTSSLPDSAQLIDSETRKTYSLRLMNDAQVKNPIRQYYAIAGRLIEARVSFPEITKQGDNFLLYELPSGYTGEDFMKAERGEIPRNSAVAGADFFRTINNMAQAGLYTPLTNIVWNGKDWIVRDPMLVKEIGKNSARVRLLNLMKRTYGPDYSPSCHITAAILRQIALAY